MAPTCNIYMQTTDCVKSYNLTKTELQAENFTYSIRFTNPPELYESAKLTEQTFKGNYNHGS